ncbi:hypothetical protein IHQ71_26675 [Rhizobium sp. TH2]|uniref:hypothetical protein n=1 Tax=Rhizobium sp. TH2 TaxID=2775403 RepID=UPI00215792DE|nr:hypothetical protein [Rhizobium sp. TH2]UVC08671.1 hypothetical protein IHQ71_26675 [Rhizobium sp. TH2]
MKIEKPKKILVIRVSKMDGVDPVEEIQKVIDKKGHCWFGKYGRLIGVKAFGKAVSKNIVIISKEGRTYKPYLFRRSAVQRTIPEDCCYPLYYNEFLRRISFWMKLRALPPYELDLADLQIVSSKMPLREMLGQAMSGHFICELRAGIKNETFV